ncbi:MAG: alpha/beta hydrolase [Firmicutes bacterium]|nr:alpha/beta hydrolase [Bacillota bacterium]
MKIKKVIKLVSFVPTALTAAAFANKFIFSRSHSEKSEETFQWLHGNVSYKKTGTGSPMLFIHSLFLGAGRHEFWRNVEEASKKHTVYAVDMPGYGFSSKPKITYTAFVLAGFINDFITHVIGRPTAVVASNGGAMPAVISAKLYPKNISKLVLISPEGITTPMAQNSDVAKRTFLELPLYGTSVYNMAASKSSIRKFLIDDGFFAPHNVSDEIVKNFYAAAHGTNSNVRYAYASYATKFMNMDIKSYFEAVEQPVFVVWGEKNTLNPVSNMHTLTKIKPEAEFFIFEETKLFPHIENCLEFNKIISRRID